ncbi:hypothetical protein BC830DRAFT_1172397 [Chytriomyces sp. MP71]|nr:hypothetical protein BC830DRAFT_1172397 [Chytriomyces sp. MP71]
MFEDEDVDIDGDDEDEVLDEGKAAPISRAAGATNASIAAMLNAGTDPFANVKKKGRPPKNREAYDAYATQVQIQMNQQLQMELQQNPEMPMEERTALVAKLRQQQQTMLNQFVVLEKESSAAASNAGNIVPNPASTGFGAAMPPVTFIEVPPAPSQQEEEEEEAEPNFECSWREENGDGCPLQYSTEAEIVKHISDDHFRDPYRVYRCQWANCTRFHDAPTSRTAVFKHLRTHVGDSSKKKSGFSQGLYKKPFKSGGIDTPEPAGITLTTLLILRNVARSQRARELFLQFEYDLTLAMVERPKYSKFISDILWELR